MATEIIFPLAGHSHKPKEYASPEDMSNGGQGPSHDNGQVSMWRNQVIRCQNNNCILANNKLNGSGTIIPAPGLHINYHSSEITAIWLSS
jgi:hypothetical protein